MNRLVNGTPIQNDGDFYEQLAVGNVERSSSVYKFGRTVLVNGKRVPLWDGNSNYVFPTSADKVTLTSDDTDDAVGGTGARTVRIFGLDENWELVDEILDVGATSVNNYIRVFRMYVQTCGTHLFPYDNSHTGNNIGTLTCTHNGTNEPIAIILPAMGQTLMAIYTIPAGYKALLVSAHTTNGKNADAIGYFYCRNNTIQDSAWRCKGIRDMYRNEVGIKHTIPSNIGEKTDIMFAVEGSGGNTVSGTFELELIKIN